MRKPPNEQERLARLRALNVLDPGLDVPLQSIATLAAQIAGCSIAFISFIESTKQIFRTTIGFDKGIDISREESICAETVLSDSPLRIDDLLAERQLKSCLLARPPHNFRFYAGFPLTTKDHLIIGTLCVADTTPKKNISSEAFKTLENLALHIVAQVELHNKLSAVQRTISSLEDSEQRFRRIADASPVLLWISDQAGNRTLSNKAWCDFTGLSQEQSLADCWRESVHVDDRGVYQAKWTQIVKTQSKFQHEYRLRHVSGTYRWVMEQAIPLFSSAGRLEAYVSSCVDLSLRSSDELQYQHNEARFRAVSEAAPLGIVVTDSNGNCIYSNGRFQAISGLSIEECLGSGWLKRIHPDDYDGISTAWAQANKTARSFEHVLRYQRSDGGISWCNLKAAAINATDTVSGWVSTIEDITEKRQAEEELKAAKQAAEAATLAKSQFLANISHEIRTPLTAIIGFADALREEARVEPSHRHCLDVILNNGRHLLSIINQILDLSKIDAGALTIEHSACALVDLVEELKIMFAPTAAEKSISFNVHYNWPLPRSITTDPLRLKQILINLIGNAIKFTSDGGVDVSVSWNQDRHQVAFEISDTGIGLTREEVENLFKPFYQANQSATRSFGGTGLGLSISRRLINALGGAINVSSEPNIGSTFSFEIQSYGERNNTHLQRATNDSPTAIDNFRHEIPRLEGRILFADDALDNRRLVEHLIRKTGARITMVENGQEATRVATEEAFDLILMDVQMPLVDGLTATRQIRSAGVKTPIVAVSAGAMTSDVEQALEAGCCMHLSKPFDRKAFYLLISKYLPSAANTKSDAPILSSIEDEDIEMRELINEFVASLPSRLAEINSSSKDGDWQKLAALAHKLKGSSGMYGFQELAGAASALEKAAKDHNQSITASCQEKITDLIRRVKPSSDANQAPSHELPV
jgi:PAS domain S-box-containing protein